MLKVYLETTIFNRFFENERDYNRETRNLFDKVAKKETEVIDNE
jgi:hypothetical protein